MLFIWSTPPQKRIPYSQGVQNSIDYYLSISTIDPRLQIGIFEQNSDSWAQTPYNEITAYRFPLLIAMIGMDLYFSSTIDDLLNRDIIYLPNSASLETKRVLCDNGFKIYETDSGISIGTKKELKIPTKHLLKNRQGSVVVGIFESKPLIINDFKFLPEETRIVITPAWNQCLLSYVAWPKNPETWRDPIKIFVKNNGNNINCLEFRPHPLGDDFPLEIRIIVNDTIFRYPLQQKDYPPCIIPIDTTNDFVLEIIADKNHEVNKTWEAPHITLFDLRALVKVGD